MNLVQSHLRRYPKSRKATVAQKQLEQETLARLRREIPMLARIKAAVRRMMR